MPRKKGDWITLNQQYPVQCDKNKEAYKMTGTGRYQVVAELTVPSGHVSDGYPRTVTGKKAEFPGNYMRNTTRNTQVEIVEVVDDSTYRVKAYLDVVHV